MNMTLALFHASLVLIAFALPAAAQTSDLGLFHDHGDVGGPALEGSATFDSEQQSYHLRAAGTNMWGSADEFHFVWRELEGNFVLRTHVRFVGDGVDPHRKAGLMIRTDLSGGSPYVDAVVHGDGLTSMQFRRTPSAETEEIRALVSHADVLQLERRDGMFIMSGARYGEPFTSVELRDLQLPDRILAGLFLCSHNPEVIEEAVFENVRIVIPPAPDYQPYRDFIGSNLEVLDLESGHRSIVFRHPGSIQAPNWTIDGRYLIYNSEGLIYRFDLETGTPELIDTGDVVNNNNDHVLSFDGTQLGLSSHNSELGGSSVYVVPADGGQPTEVTTRAPSYLHGWSPDGDWLIYTAERGDGNYDIYKIPSTGGLEIRLTDAPGLDDGSEYTPDGAYIYFNSVRSGSMEIWRMHPDGSEQEQVTDDNLNNWFPHISPDGERIVFLSYGQDVDPSDHPFYRHVYLRSMPTAGGEPRVVAYLFGGQGTINVPSFSPDGTRVAFVSNTDLPIE